MSKLHPLWVRVCISAAATALLALGGCGSSQNVPRAAGPAAGSIIAVIGLPPSEPAGDAIVGGARRFATTISHLRVQIIVRGSDDTALLNRLVDDVISRKPAAVCLGVPQDSAPHPTTASATSEPFDPVVELIERIDATGCLVVTYGRRTRSARVFAHVEGDYAAGAEKLANALPTLLAGRQTYVLQHTAGRSERASQCYARFTAAAGRRYGFSMLEERNAWIGGGPPGMHMTDLLARFPHVALAISLEPDVWTRSQPPVTLPADARYATLSATPDLWPDVRGGRAAALIGPIDGDIGYRAVQLAWSGLTGGARGGEVELVRCELVTADNIDDFARRYRLAGGETPPRD